MIRALLAVLVAASLPATTSSAREEPEDQVSFSEMLRQARRAAVRAVETGERQSWHTFPRRTAGGGQYFVRADEYFQNAERRLQRDRARLFAEYGWFKYCTSPAKTEASRMLRESLCLNPEDSKTHCKIASVAFDEYRLLHRAGHHAKARSKLSNARRYAEEANAIAKRMPYALWLLGMIAKEEGKVEERISYLHEFTEVAQDIDPEFFLYDSERMRHSVSRGKALAIRRPDEPTPRQREELSNADPLSLVKDKTKDIALRVQAVGALPERLSAESLAALRAIFRNIEEHEGIRAKIFQALLRADELSLVSDLTNMLWDDAESIGWRQQAVSRLKSCHDARRDPQIPHTLLRAAQSNELRISTAALSSLAGIIESSLKKKPEEGAIDLVVLEGTRDLALQKLRDDGAHERARANAVRVSAQLGLPQVLPAIRRMIRDNKTGSNYLRRVIITYFGVLGDETDIPLVESLSNHFDAQIRSEVAIAVQSIRRRIGPRGGPEPEPLF